MADERLLDVVIDEYFVIIEYLRDKKELVIVENQMVVDREHLIRLLTKNLFLKPTDKLNIYKKLNLIDAGKDRSCTKVIYDKALKKSVRKFVLNYDTYEVLKHLYATNIKVNYEV